MPHPYGGAATASGGILAVTVLGALLDCASVPLAPAAQDSVAKSFQPPPGKANLYIFRPDAFKMSAVTVNVAINGHELGLMKVGTYLHAVLEPGEYTLLSQSSTPLPVLVQAQPNTNYFFQQVVEEAAFWKSFARTVLLPVDEARGREQILASQLAASQPPAQPKAAPTGCTKDTDCKGDRVCTAGVCVGAP